MRKLLAAAAVIALATGTAAARATAHSETFASLTNYDADCSAAIGSSVARTGMRVSLLRAGASIAEVEQVLGQPTVTSRFDQAGGDKRVLVYGDEPVRTHVTAELGRVTEIGLDFVSIDKSRLPERARMILPMMTRGGLLSLLGRPSRVESWPASGMSIEQMLFALPNVPEFSVFLADGLVVDVRNGTERPADLGRVVLPTAIPDASAGADLRIGMTPAAAATAVGREVRAVTSLFKGQPVVYADHVARDGNGLVSLTFTGGVLTAFAVWPSDVAVDYGDVRGIADR
jgi:outer membrane protein assembly factor BamE (lipoprotein component of BamABCDE complex)